MAKESKAPQSREVPADGEKGPEEKKGGGGKPKSGKKKRKHTALKIFALVIVSFVCVWLFFSITQHLYFETVFYEIDSGKTDTRIRVVQLTDLHNWKFGKDNEKLVSRIRELKPDIIAITGDMMMKQSDDISVAASLCGKLVEIAPVYYVFGNHELSMVYNDTLTSEFLESWAEKTGTDEIGNLDFDKIEMVDSRLPDALRAEGVVILNNGYTSVEINGVTIDIAGIACESDAYHLYSYYMAEECLGKNKEHIKLVLSHRLGVANALKYQGWLNYDLYLCGHTHGGIVRLPGLGGMFSEGKGWPWFTKPDAGLYKTEQGTILISGGLGNSKLIPRINNMPELSVIDLH